MSENCCFISFYSKDTNFFENKDKYTKQKNFIDGEFYFPEMKNL